MSYLYTTTELTKQQQDLLEISMDNCYQIFDPKRQNSRQMLIETIDGQILDNYYVVLFISNTCELFDQHNKINCEMMSKLGKYLREFQCVPKREKLFKQLSTDIRQLCLSFIPLIENGLFYKIWSQLLEFAQIQRNRDIEDGTYDRELEIVYNEPSQSELIDTTETQKTETDQTDQTDLTDIQLDQTFIQDLQIEQNIKLEQIQQQTDHNGMLYNDVQLEEQINLNYIQPSSYKKNKKSQSDSEVDIQDIQDIYKLVDNKSIII